jgi:hypothetical protein
LELRRRLYRAAMSGNVAEVRKLVALGGNMDAKDVNGGTPLLWAAYNGHVEAIKTFVKSGADKDVKTAAGETPLHYAAGNGHVEAIRVLAQLGVDITAQTAAGMTALQLSLQKGHHQAAQVLRELEDIARAEQAEAAAAASERAQQAAEQASQGSVVAAEEDARCVSVCSHRANWCHPRPIVCMISLQGSHSRVLCGRWLQVERHGSGGALVYGRRREQLAAGILGATRSTARRSGPGACAQEE